jgi:hypothetical protein
MSQWPLVMEVVLMAMILLGKKEISLILGVLL